MKQPFHFFKLYCKIAAMIFTLFITSLAEVKAQDYYYCSQFSDAELIAYGPWLCPDSWEDILYERYNNIPTGFPNSNIPIPLKEVPITRPGRGGDYYYPTFPTIPFIPGAPGYSIERPPRNPETNPKPCPSDPVKYPVLAPSSAGNFKGGTYGLTRNGGTKFHDGVDVSATPGTDLYAMYGGEVTKIQNSFTPGEYRAKSYGNYVEVKSVVNGVVVYLKYNHLDAVGTTIAVGMKVNQGDMLGLTGTTGNAAGPGVIPHVHIQAKDANYQKMDPEPLIGTKFDKTNGSSIRPCSN